MIMVGFGLTGAASAQDIISDTGTDSTNTITNTGTDSTNTITDTTTDNCQVNNDTDISVVNSNDQSATTGNALAVGNTTLPWEAATTGDATNNNSVSFVINIDNTANTASMAPATTTDMMPPATDACGNPIVSQLPIGGKGGGPTTTSYGGYGGAMSKRVYTAARKYGGKGSYHRYYAPVTKHTVHVAAAPVVHTASAPAPPAPAAPATPSAPAPAAGNTISNTGTGSHNVITSSYTDNSSVHNTNTVSASNMNVQTASSGNATSAGNTTAGGGGSGAATNGNSTGVGAGITN